MTYYSHYYKFVAGVSILLGSTLTSDDLQKAQDLLDLFCKEITDVYGNGTLPECMVDACF